MVKKTDIGITITFLILNILLMVYNKSISHPNYLGYLIVLLYVGFAHYCTSRKNTKLLVIVIILSFFIAILTDYLYLNLNI